MSSQLQVSGEAKIRAIQGPVVANSGVITALDGAASQYVRGDGTLADFPTSSGGGSSVSYYLNSSVSQGTIMGIPFRELSKEPIIGAGTDITISADGYVAGYITDANDPDVILVPGGNFNCEFYFSVNNNTGNPFTFAELYKYDGTNFTLLGTSVGVPEYINQGTIIAPYYFAIPVPSSPLALTDRLAIRIYVNVDGRTVTLHTENGHLCQVVTTLSKGMVSLNNLTDQSQYLTTGTSGTNFAIASSGDTHTFNLPVASAANTGKLSSTDWSTFNGKVPYTGATANLDLGLFSISGSILFLNGTPTTIPGYLYLKKIGNAAYINYAGYGGITAYSNNFTFISDVNGTDMKKAIFDLASLTNNTARTFTLPDLSGTLALLEGTQTFSGLKTFDLGLLLKEGVTPSSVGYTGLSGDADGLVITKRVGSTAYTNLLYFNSATSNSYIFPNASGTLALLESNQTFTGGNIFSTNISVSGITIGKGRQAGSGTSNIGIGFAALAANTTGINNLAIGSGTLYNNTTGNHNIALGYNTLEYNTTGGNNIALGLNTLGDNTTGINNIGIGIQALDKSTTADGNIAVGYGALNLSTTGAYNTAVGYGAGSAITTGSNNTIIGNYVGTTTLANNIVLADGAGNIRYQFNGTNNIFTSALGINSTSLTGISFRNSRNLTGATTTFANYADGQVQTDATSISHYFYSEANVIAATTATAIYHFKATQGTFGAGSSLTVQAGLVIDASLSGAGTNYGIISNIDAATNNWNLYIGGSAKNWIASSLGIGAGTQTPTATLDVNGTLKASGAATFSSSVTANSFISSSTGNANVFNSASATTGWVQIAMNNTSGSAILGIESSVAGTTTNGSLAYATILRNYTATDLQFATNNIVRTTITSGGNVGIGTTTITPIGSASNRALAINAPSGNASMVLLQEGGTTYGYVYGYGGDAGLFTSAAIPLIFGTNSVEKIRITSGGNVLIGATAAAASVFQFQVGNGTADTRAYFNPSNAFALGLSNSGGNVYYLGVGTSGAAGSFQIYSNTTGSANFSITSGGVITIANLAGTGSRAVLADASGNLSAPVSDISVKQNISTIGYGLNEILKMNPVWFDFIDDYKNYGEGRQNGMIAQEVAEVIPEAVFVTPSTGKMGINYDQMHAVYIKAIQELKLEIEILKNK
jgi:hypothetical protein